MRPTSFLFLCGLVFFGLVSSGNAQPQPDETLAVDKPVEREMKAGETHAYRFKLDRGTFLSLVVEQKKLDVRLLISGPAGEKLLEQDGLSDPFGPETLTILADQAGDYRVEIQPVEKEAAVGRYEIKVLEQRPTRLLDRETMLGQQAFMEGRRFARSPSPTNSPKALEAFQAACRHWHQAGNQLQEAQALSWLGLLSADVVNRRKGLELLTQALPLFQAVGNRSAEAITWQNLGTAYSQVGEPQKSLEAHAQALKLYHETGNQWGEADTLANLGVAYSRMGDTPKAMEYYTKGVALSRAIGDQKGEASTLNSMGAGYSALGEYRKALECYERALTLRRDLSDKFGVGRVLYNMGASYNALSENQKALDLYAQCLLIFRALDDKGWEAATLNNIARVHSLLGAYLKALDYYQQALAITQSLKDRPTEAIALNNIGQMHLRLGDSRKALEFYTQSLAIKREVGDRRGEATTLSNIANLQAEAGEYQKALETYLQVLPLRRTIGDRDGVSNTLNNLGKVYADLGDSPKALEYYSEALLIRRALGNRTGEANTLSNLAFEYRKQGDFTAAKNHIEDALKLAELIRASVASKELRASYLATVRIYYEFYIDVLIRLHRQNPASGFDREALFISEQARARSLLELLAESGTDIRRGVNADLLEQERGAQKEVSAKLNNLTKLLTQKHTDEQEATARKEVEVSLETLRQVQHQIRLTSPRYAALTQPKILTAAEIQAQLDPETLLLEYTLGKDSSFLFAVTSTSMDVFTLPKPDEIETAARKMYDLATIRNRLAEPGPKALAQIEEADRDYGQAAATVSQMILGPVAGQLNKKRLLIVADGFLHYVPFGALPNPRVPGSGFRVPGESSSPTLKEVRGSSPTVKEGSVPGPRPPAPDPLLVNFEIVNLPSISTLAVLRAEKQDRKAPAKLLAVLADPVFGGTDDERVRALARKGEATQVAPNQVAANNQQTLTRLVERAQPKESAKAGGRERGFLLIRRLPKTRVEAESILAQTNAAESLKALDFDANRTLALSDQLSNYRYVHFATHGLLDAEQPELSALVLSLVDREGQPQDGFLRVFDVFNLNLPAEVVTLSACKTGLGKEIKGEGLVGMTRGFMYAGASRVVVSLWNIEDRASAELMKRFYQGMLGPQKLSPAAALRAAQLEMWRQKRWSPPYYWAAFVLQGEPN